MKTILSIAAASLLMAGAAHAQQAKSPLYGELGYTSLKLASEGSSLKPGMLRGIIGFDFHPNIAFEGMLGFGIKDDSYTDNSFGVPVTVETEVQQAYGAFVKPKFNVSPELELFARIGFVNTKVKATASVGGVSASASDDDSSVAYGVGLNYRFSPNMYVGADYVNYYKKDGAKIDGVTVGLGFRF